MLNKRIGCQLMETMDSGHFDKTRLGPDIAHPDPYRRIGIKRHTSVWRKRDIRETGDVCDRNPRANQETLTSNASREKSCFQIAQCSYTACLQCFQITVFM